MELVRCQHPPTLTLPLLLPPSPPPHPPTQHRLHDRLRVLIPTLDTDDAERVDAVIDDEVLLGGLSA